MLDPVVVTRIRNSIEQALAPLPVSDVHLLEGEDYAGDEVLFVTVDFPGGTGPVPGKAYLEAMGAVGEVLLNAGDERLPYFRTTRAGEIEPANVEAMAAP